MKGKYWAYRDRKNRKREFRALWNIRISAAARANNTTFSKFIDALKKAQIELDRKVLADLAVSEPKAFAELLSVAAA